MDLGSSRKALDGEERAPKRQEREPDVHGPALLPLLPANRGEPMVKYFVRLREEAAHAGVHRADDISSDGLYLHKRPIVFGPNGTNPLAGAGSVFHHAVLYFAAGGKIVAMLDWGAGEGADVTANVMEPAPGRPVITPGPDAQAPPPGTPMLYCGACPAACADTLRSLDQLRAVVEHVEAGHYHALWRNCIHVADLLVRALTSGAVVSAPLLYDVLVGEVPASEPFALVMFQLIAQRHWFEAVDGSALARELHAAAGPAGVPWARATPAGIAARAVRHAAEAETARQKADATAEVQAASALTAPAAAAPVAAAADHADAAPAAADAGPAAAAPASAAPAAPAAASAAASAPAAPAAAAVKAEAEDGGAAFPAEVQAAAAAPVAAAPPAATVEEEVVADAVAKAEEEGEEDGEGVPGAAGTRVASGAGEGYTSQREEEQREQQGQRHHANGTAVASTAAATVV
ncbi:hypothetical protein FOA52_008519 [Chlamydomonas sp. UWO 241]|nr:hypothetical protein FOA52_008519 [Chlamydomonas sp. UWO 241]